MKTFENDFDELIFTNKYIPTEKSEFAVEILKQYATENGIPARSTSDLSPMEEWLIIQLFIKEKNKNSNT